MKINFYKKYYNLESIERSIDAFSDFGNFSVKKEGDYFLVKANKIDKDLADNFQEEFCNYVLSEVVKRT